MDLELGIGQQQSNIIRFPIAKPDGPITSPNAQGHAGTIGPIEREMRAKLAKMKDCKYPDNFDWSVYDRIAANFDTPPKGGVVFGTTFKLANWHPTCSKCHYAFELDTYGRGCFHDCAYCYAKDSLTSRGYWNRPQPFPVDLSEIRKIFYTVFETDKKTKWRHVIQQRIPLRIGSMSDSFLWLDTKYHVTKELLKILSFYKYPNVIFTRSDLAAHDDYLSIMNPSLTSVQYSISGDNWSLMRKIEPGAPSYKRRLKAISKLSENGFRTAVRINPLLPNYPDGYFTDPEYIKARFDKNIPKATFYSDNFVSDIADAGTDSLIVGFMRLKGKATRVFSQHLGFDFRQFFKPELAPKSGNADGHYTAREIQHYYKYFRDLASKNGVRFTTCYIGNGIKEYYAHQNLWDNRKDCCDIVGSLQSFRKTSQNIDWEERKLHATSKDMADSTIEQEKAFSNIDSGIDPISIRSSNKRNSESNISIDP